MASFGETHEHRDPRDRPLDDAISLAELAGILINYRWTVIGAFVLSLTIAVGYALGVPPEYRSDVLMHGEGSDSKMGLLADLQLASNSEPTARAAEPILRSRAILGKIVDEFQLTLQIRPRHFPLIGAALARRHHDEGLAPPLFGMATYAWGGERLEIEHLAVPHDYAGAPLVLIAQQQGFILYEEEGGQLLAGPVGETVESNGFSIRVKALAARAGTAFEIRKIRTTEAIDAVKKKLRVAAGGRSGIAKENIIRVEYQDTDPARAAAILNRITEHYVNYHIQRNSEEAEKTLVYIERQLEELAKDVTFDNNLYFMLMTKAQELRVLKAGVVGGINIVDVAVPSSEPVEPKRSLLAGAGGLFGLLIGIVLAFVRHGLDRTVHDPEELEVRSGVEVFGIIPNSRVEMKLTRPSSSFFSPPREPQLLSEFAENDLAVEGLRYLRTAFQFHLRANHGPLVVAITGTTASVGKTFVSTNLAYLLSQSGKRVVLLDTDVYRGRAYEYFTPSRGPGFTDYLAGVAGIEEIVYETRVERLLIVPPGENIKHHSHALENGRLQALITELKARFDVVLIDTPPLLAVADSVVIGRESDTVLLVTRAGQTMFTDISASLRRLLQAGVQVSGIILNDMSFTGRGYGHPYGRYGHVPEYLVARARG